MKRFAFRFESVAKVRKIEMERQARALAETQLKVKAIEKEIAEIVGTQTDEVQRLQGLALRGALTQQLMELSDKFRKELKRRLNFKRLELRDWENKVREERDKLVEKEKRRKVIEKVREKDFENYQEEKRKDEAKQMDEVASQLWSRHFAPESEG
jgi:flagellar FliJ protein